MNPFRRHQLTQALQRLQKRLTRRKALILMYHHVAEVDRDPWSLCVSPQHFTEQLQVLQDYTQPMSLQQLAQSHQQGTLPHRAVAITFDDGYADNLYQAKPLLEQYNIPATVFVSTGYLGQEREFWWDELEQLLLQPGTLPNTLTLTVNGHSQHWNLETATTYSEADYRGDRHQHAWKATPGSRLFFYYRIWQWLQPMTERDRHTAFTQLAIWATTTTTLRPTHRTLTPTELSDLSQGPLVEIGAHTVTHPFLSAQTTHCQQDEIQRSKIDLETLLHQPITSFSYPFGDHTAETVEITQAAGFSCACTTVPDIIWARSQRFQLPRMTVENWSGAQFNQQLSRWFHD